ncbi:MAG: arginine--tRNA ligase [Deltaproteobacteria bacterium]|nr:arginine--tRNA ligase [Deltaproteobacteria bacterium]
MRSRLAVLIEKALRACCDAGFWEPGALPFVEVELAKDPAHGDYASNVAMVLASRVGRKPREIAERLVGQIHDTDKILQKVEIAGPGFLNFFVREDVWATLLKDIERQADRYGMSDSGKGRKVLLEFVSANPTGPLHIGHARGAVVGDVIANILAASGYDISREYYINDAGNQMANLGRSVLLRYRQLLGETVHFPENCYRGDYIKTLAAELLDREGPPCPNDNGESLIPYFTDYAAGAILEGIKEDLGAFGVTFDRYFSERDLYEDRRLDSLLEDLEKGGFIYREEETLWFRTTAFGDEKDRVVVRKTGEPTYFAADIAYHQNKYERGFDFLIDVWGADHHGYIPRILAGIQALDHDKDSLRVILVQLVNLLRDGKPIAMSTRSGEFVTLREVVDEVGRDAARYNFLMRRSDSHLDFDLELAKRQSNENPVYYVQYAHARIASVLRTAGQRNLVIPSYSEVDRTLLKLPEEIGLIKTITRFPEIVEGAARTLEPHRLTFYLNDLAGLFHSYYNKNRIISEEGPLTAARLFLVVAVKIVIGNALKLLGVSSPESM